MQEAAEKRDATSSSKEGVGCAQPYVEDGRPARYCLQRDTPFGFIRKVIHHLVMHSSMKPLLTSADASAFTAWEHRLLHTLLLTAIVRAS